MIYICDKCGKPMTMTEIISRYTFLGEKQQFKLTLPKCGPCDVVKTTPEFDRQIREQVHKHNRKK